ncbi:PREDICTED: LOW QUALITY PROTEIN: proline-rich protein 36-like [Mandrillus leucophaeus]|uniref:LOW QUALITY PROTEIN: proline-rich protein 36-like n=1 Tax=Mandrillus leucophaeus TaxID=9568 RepID=UPI0005F5634F|nr:PREDICTED: LOW QUALITY PROTEIN: proline-rich protein 36-like [Mandrillus leucophaeus]
MSSSPGHKIQAQNVHKSASEGPAPAFRWPLQAQLLSPGLLPGCVYTLSSNQTTTSVDIPLAKLLTAYVGPKLPQRKLIRPNSTHMGDSAGRNHPEVGSSSPEVLLTFGSFDRHHSCLLVAALHPAHSSRGMAFAGPLLAFWRPLQAPNFLRLPPVSLSRPSSSSWRHLQANAVFESDSPGFAPAPGGLCGPNSSLSQPAPAHLLPLRGLSSCQTSSGLAPAPGGPCGPNYSTVDLHRPSSCLSAASASARLPQAQPMPFGGLSRPRASSGRPLQAQLWPPVLPSRPSSSCSRLRPRAQPHPHDNLFGLDSGPAPAPRPLEAPNVLKPGPMVASPGPTPAPRPPVRAEILLLPAVAVGPAPASRQPLWTRLRPSSRSAAFVGPKRPESGPHGGLSGPTLASSLGLSRARSCSRRPLRAQLVAQSASAGPAPASPRPPQLPDFLRCSPSLTKTSLDSAPAQLPSAAFVGPKRPEAGPTVASPGPAPALRRRLHAPDFLQPASPGPAPPAGGLCRPTLASIGLRRPSSCLSAASPAARLPQVSLSRPSSSCLPLAS